MMSKKTTTSTTTFYQWYQKSDGTEGGWQEVSKNETENVEIFEVEENDK